MLAFCRQTSRPGTAVLACVLPGTGYEYAVVTDLGPLAGEGSLFGSLLKS